MTQGRQVLPRLILPSRASCHPGPLVCCGRVSWATAPASLVQSSLAQAGKRKQLLPALPSNRARGSYHFLPRRNRDKGLTPPPLDPTQDNSMVSRVLELKNPTPPGSKVSPTPPCQCKRPEDAALLGCPPGPGLERAHSSFSVLLGGWL